MFILPHLEQPIIQDRLGTATDNWEDNWVFARDTNGAIIASAELPVFMCVSDAHQDGIVNKFYTHRDLDSTQEYYGKSNYVACAGANGFNQCSNKSFVIDSGIFASNSKTSFSGITDGSSNTILLGERSSLTEKQAGHTSSNRENYGAIWAGRVNSNSHLNYSAGRRGAEYGVAGIVFSDNAANWSAHIPPL